MCHLCLRWIHSNWCTSLWKLCVIKLEMSGEILISPTFKIWPHLTIYMFHVICPCTASVCILLSTCHSEVLCGKFTLFYDFHQRLVVKLIAKWAIFEQFCFVDMSQFAGLAKKPKLTHFTHLRSAPYRPYLRARASKRIVWGTIGNIRVSPTIWYQI